VGLSRGIIGQISGLVWAIKNPFGSIALGRKPKGKDCLFYTLKARGLKDVYFYITVFFLPCQN